MEFINVAGLKSHLSEVLARVSEKGESVVIGRYGVPVARIMPVEEPTEGSVRKVGFGKHLLMSRESIVQNQVDSPTDDDTLSGFYS